MSWTAEVWCGAEVVFVADKFTYEQALTQAVIYARSYRDPEKVVITVERTT